MKYESPEVMHEKLIFDRGYFFNESIKFAPKISESKNKPSSKINTRWVEMDHYFLKPFCDE